MKTSSLIFTINISILLGILTYAYFNELIIIKNPWQPDNTVDEFYKKTDRISVNLYFWRHDQWKVETVSAILPIDNIQDQAMIIIQSWLHEAYQTGFIKNNGSVEAILFDPRYRCLYISLNMPLFDINQSTRDALCILESLLKTIDTSVSKQVQYVQILIHHKSYEHPHIDFTIPFPTTGLGIIN